MVNWISYHLQKNNYKGVKTILSQNNDTDVLEDEGIYLRIAIRIKNGKMFGMFLDYHQKNVLDKDTTGTKILELQTLLEEEVLSRFSEDEIPEEILDIIDYYLDIGEDYSSHVMETNTAESHDYDSEFDNAASDDEFDTHLMGE